MKSKRFFLYDAHKKHRLSIEFSEGRGERPIIILCHGLGVTRSYPLITSFFHFLASKDFSVVRFDFSGHGESSGGIQARKVSTFISDLGRVDRWCRMQRPGAEVIIIGHSIGALSALVYASHHKNIRGLVLIGCNADVQKKYEDLLSRGRIQRLKKYEQVGEVKVGKNFWQDRGRYEPPRMIKKILADVLFLCGAEDRINPPSESRQLYRLAKGSKKIKIIPRADHFFMPVTHRQRACTLINHWLGRIQERKPL